MTCETFRRVCAEGVRDDEMLAHLRSCADCLEYAVEIDPDLLFRSLGGEVDPPGGVDQFTAEVMQQIHVREAELKTGRSSHSHPYRWAAAAVLVAGLAGTLFLGRPRDPAPVLPGPSTAITAVEAAPIDDFFVPVVDRYDSHDAMIVEVPTNPEDNIRIVMIFDENLPLDL